MKKLILLIIIIYPNKMKISFYKKLLNCKFDKNANKSDISKYKYFNRKKGYVV